MNTNDEVKTVRKDEFEPARIEVIIFDAKADIICESPIEGEGFDEF